MPAVVDATKRRREMLMIDTSVQGSYSVINSEGTEDTVRGL
jgi:hypothetical protein